MFSYEATMRSVIGTRTEQQDYAILKNEEDSLLAVVCDGMGGLYAGNKASEAAAIELMLQYEKKDADEPITDFFSNIVDILDEKVFSLTDKENENFHSGTTIVAIHIKGENLNWLSIGDSRLYIIRDNEIVQATRDHNYNLTLNDMLQHGEISAEDYDIEKRRGDSLISFIGMGGISVMDISKNPFIVQKGDYILITTDGLFKILSADEIKKVILSGKEVEKLADDLISNVSAQSNGEQDNTTFVLVKIN